MELLDGQRFTLENLPDPSVVDELTVIRFQREGPLPQIFDVDAIDAFKREGKPGALPTPRSRPALVHLYHLSSGSGLAWVGLVSSASKAR
jgi:hypothetical protein